MKKLHVSDTLSLPAEDFIEAATGIIGKRKRGKALALDTPIPTPDGWTTMGELRVGDVVFDEQGQPCRVVRSEEVMHGRPCYRVYFNDGASIVADADHLWMSETLAYRRAMSLRRWKADKRGGPPSASWAESRPQCQPRVRPEILTTEKMAATLTVKLGLRYDANHSIPCARALELPDAELPMDPYVLGCWLGDGTSRNADLTTMDEEVLVGVTTAGHSVAVHPWGNAGKAKTYGMRMPSGASMQTALRAMGVLRNKHIPHEYLRASKAQRLRLLQGLMDTDGYATQYGDAVFYNTNLRLAEQAYELVCSLGWYARFGSKRATLYGRDMGPVYSVRFRPFEQVFTVSRKAARIRTDVRFKPRRIVTAVEPVESVPVRCIAVDSPSRLFLAGKAMVPTHNSGLERVIAEELLDAGLPFVWLDFVGIAWGLRSSADGKKKGYSILIVGGAHGDVPLDARAGKDVARAIIKANVSVVIDLSKSTKGDWRRFVTEFCDTLFSENDTSRLVILDEASEFIPQRFRPDMAACFEAVERLVSRGRNQGLGVIIADQRAARVNKDVLSQVDYLMCFGVSHPIDLKNLKEWVELQADPALMGEFTKGLAGLQPREAWCWNPELGIFQKFRVRDFKTLHPDKTHLRKIGMLERKAVTSDVTSVVEALGDVLKKLKVEQVEEQDAKREIHRLRVELEAAKREAARGTKVERVVERVEVPVAVVTDADLVKLQDGASTILDGIKGLRAKVGNAKLEERRVKPKPMPPAPSTHQQIKPKAHKVAAAADSGAAGMNGLGGPHKAILTALARIHANGTPRPGNAQVAAWAGYSPRGGAFNNPLGTLRSHGLVDKTGDGTMALTVEGHAFIGSPDPLSPEELREQVLGMLSGPEAKILRVLIDKYPAAVGKEELAMASGYDANGGSFNNPRGRLHTMGLVTYPGGGLTRAAEFLFEGGEA